MGLAERKRISRRPRAERAGDILRAARSAFAAHGYDGALIADIAAAAGIAEGTIYKLFDSKRDLLHAVMDDWYGGFTHDLAQRLRGLDDPAQKLRYLIRHHLSVIEDEPALCRVFFREIRADDYYPGSAMFELNRTYTNVTLAVLQEGIAAGVFTADFPAGMLRDVIFGGLEHYTWQFLAGRKSLDIDRATELFWRLIVRGIGTEQEPGGDTAWPAPLVERLEAATARLEQLGSSG